MIDVIPQFLTQEIFQPLHTIKGWKYATFGFENLLANREVLIL